MITIGEPSEHQLIFGETKAVVIGVHGKCCAVIYIAEANKAVKKNIEWTGKSWEFQKDDLGVHADGVASCKRFITILREATNSPPPSLRRVKGTKTLQRSAIAPHSSRRRR